MEFLFTLLVILVLALLIHIIIELFDPTVYDDFARYVLTLRGKEALEEERKEEEE
jgi:hypothetical protein